jgi:hypothetical protein
MFIPVPLIFFGIPKPSGEAGTKFVFLLTLFSVIGTAVLFLLCYLGSRMQLVFFDIVLMKSKIIAPLWRKYSSRTWRWIGLKLAVILPLEVLVSWPLLSRFRHMTSQFPTQPASSPSPELLQVFFLTFFLTFFGIFFIILCSSLLSDFVLPFIALEEISITEAMQRFSQLLKAEPWQAISYIFFKVILSFGGGVGWYIGILLAMILAAIPFGIVAGLGWLLLHSFGLIGHILMTVGGMVLYLLFMVFLFYMEIGLYGCILVFLQAYALYFLGGRYTLLGDLLEPPVSDIAWTVAPPLPLAPRAEPPLGGDPALS